MYAIDSPKLSGPLNIVAGATPQVGGGPHNRGVTTPNSIALIHPGQRRSASSPQRWPPRSGSRASYRRRPSQVVLLPFRFTVFP